MRCVLHYNAQSDRNFLDFEAQENMTRQLFARGQSPQAWMKEYFEHARIIFKEARRSLDTSEKSQSSLLDNFRDWRARLSNSEFTVSREHVLLRDPAQAENDPAVLFRLLEFIARHNLRLSADTERRMARSPPLVFRLTVPSRRRFGARWNRILSQPYATAALRVLDETRLLGALLLRVDQY